MRPTSAAHVLAGLAMVAWLFPAAGTAQHSPSAKDQGNDAPRRHAFRSITLEDIVTLREIAEQRIAPDGKTVAFVVTKARVKSNDHHTALYVVDVTIGRSKKLVDEVSISNVRWTPDGSGISYLAPRGGAQRLLRVPRRGGRPAVLYSGLPSLANYEWSPDGTQIALVPADLPDAAAERRIQADGLVYTPRHQYKYLVDRRWAPHRPPSIQVYSIRRRTLDSVWTESTAEVLPLRFSWSEDGRHLAIMHQASDKPEDLNNYDITVVELATKAEKRVAPWVGFEMDPVWSPDGRALAFLSQGNLRERTGTTHINGVFVASIDADPEPVPLGPFTELSDARVIGWTSGGDSVLFERSARSTGAVYAAPVAGGAVKMLSATDDHLSGCSKPDDQPIVSCIRQNLTTPPEIAVVELGTGNVRTLTQLNPEYDVLTLGRAAEIRWTNRYGHETNGFLTLPANYSPGTRYPFLIILYGFEQKFSAQAQWIPNFPTQAFARDGFIVLMMNYPPETTYRHGGAGGHGAFTEIDNPLASIEAAADTLVAMGVADPVRGGLLGWSMGSYLTDLAITRTNRFKAASSGETGLRSAATYWLYSDGWRYFQRGVMGSPVGSGYLNYLGEASPPLMPPPRDVAILKEYESHALHGLEYVLWWEQGAQMELVFYPDEEHVFVQPLHRLASMQRNLAWFNFWLRGVEDPDPSRREQYTRWRAFRDSITARSPSRVSGF